MIISFISCAGLYFISAILVVITLVFFIACIFDLVFWFFNVKDHEFNFLIWLKILILALLFGAITNTSINYTKKLDKEFTSEIRGK